MQSLPETGIDSIGLHFPPLAMQVEELAQLRGADPDKYTIGLGCRQMALCPPEYDVARLASEAARRAVARWDGDKDRIGLVVVGTESAMDMSRPLSAWVANELGLKGAVRSYEVKHACYGGTVALRQALEWRWSGAAQGKAALVVAADIGLYAPKDPGEPTQGAGAVAMVVDRPSIASIDPVSHSYSEPVFDFWRPVGQDFPSVDGPLSLDCYMRSSEACFRSYAAGRDLETTLSDIAAVCFHVPFPKMVKKAVRHLGESFGWDQKKADELFKAKVDPTMDWNRATGNSYTASLWTAVASALAGRDAGQRLLAFSYGSGLGSELQRITTGPKAKQGAWCTDVEADLGERRLVDAQAYEALRA